MGVVWAVLPWAGLVYAALNILLVVIILDEAAADPRGLTLAQALVTGSSTLLLGLPLLLLACTRWADVVVLRGATR